MTPSRRLLAIADDLSGAAEVAAAVCSRTTRSRVLLFGGPGTDGMATALRPRHIGEATVLDLDSRYRPAAEAAEAVRGALRMSWPDGTGPEVLDAPGALGAPDALDALDAPGALDALDTFVLKKIDSLLRGNVAAEIAALAEDGAGVVLAPALPIAGRVVRSGVVHIGGVPLHEGDAWRAEAVPPPVSVAHALGGLPTALIPLTTVRSSRPTLLTALRAAATAGLVAICDAETDADLDAIVEAALADGPGMRLVGSGGLALAVGRHLATAFPATGARAAPDATDPAAQGAMGPAAPGATSPTTPGATSPTAPGARSPAIPGATDPAAPAATNPTTPGTTNPTTPGATSPATPGATNPATPGATNPTAPAATNPATPGTTNPTTPGATSPDAEGAGSPDAAGLAGADAAGSAATAVGAPAGSDDLGRGAAVITRAPALAPPATTSTGRPANTAADPDPAAPSAHTGRPVLVVVGTAEPAAVEQVRRLVADGAHHQRLPLAGLLADGSLARLPALTAAVTVVSLDAPPKSPGPAPAYEAMPLPSPRPVAEPVSGRRLVLGLARAVGAAVAAHDGAVDLVLTGGETARRVLDALAVTELDPVGQVHHGAVHLRTPDGRSVVTRPGSFGDPDSLRHIVQALRPHSTERKVTS
ncbi:four-carbon acid sugar kinase family protein [Streptomyces iranensis]|uniref:four-carbon acid sugar kinase family protein n=1 Tax=Streptomyces iranensis TaxID=576784 RepID=UPI0039B74EDA